MGRCTLGSLFLVVVSVLSPLLVWRLLSVAGPVCVADDIVEHWFLYMEIRGNPILQKTICRTVSWLCQYEFVNLMMFLAKHLNMA
jgi:hypothetical protein